MTKEEFMIEDITRELAEWLMSERHLSAKEALQTIYTSDTYRTLINHDSGLYSQSTAYIYEYLENELNTGKMSQK